MWMTAAFSFSGRDNIRAEDQSAVRHEAGLSEFIHQTMEARAGKINRTNNHNTIFRINLNINFGYPRSMTKL